MELTLIKNKILSKLETFKQQNLLTQFEVFSKYQPKSLIQTNILNYDIGTPENQLKLIHFILQLRLQKPSSLWCSPCLNILKLFQHKQKHSKGIFQVLQKQVYQGIQSAFDYDQVRQFIPFIQELQSLQFPTSTLQYCLCSKATQLFMQASLIDFGDMVSCLIFLREVMQSLQVTHRLQSCVDQIGNSLVRLPRTQTKKQKHLTQLIHSSWFSEKVKLTYQREFSGHDYLYRSTSLVPSNSYNPPHIEDLQEKLKFQNLDRMEFEAQLVRPLEIPIHIKPDEQTTCTREIEKVKVGSKTYVVKRYTIKKEYKSELYLIDEAMILYSAYYELSPQHFMKILGAFWTEDRKRSHFNIVLEYCPSTLKNYSNQYVDYLNLTTKMIQAISMLSQKGIAHLDIKPDNIFVRSSGLFVLGDFNISRQYHQGLGTRITNFHGGTYDFLAPELRQNIQNHEKFSYNPVKADLFSLGLTILFKIVGMNKNMNDLSRNSANELQANIDSQLALVADQKLKVLLEQMLRVDPSERYNETDLLVMAHSDVWQQMRTNSIQVGTQEVQQMEEEKSLRGRVNWKKMFLFSAVIWMGWIYVDLWILVIGLGILGAILLMTVLQTQFFTYSEKQLGNYREKYFAILKFYRQLLYRRSRLKNIIDLPVYDEEVHQKLLLGLYKQLSACTSLPVLRSPPESPKYIFNRLELFLEKLKLRSTKSHLICSFYEISKFLWIIQKQTEQIEKILQQYKELLKLPQISSFDPTLLNEFQKFKFQSLVLYQLLSQNQQNANEQLNESIKLSVSNLNHLHSLNSPTLLKKQPGELTQTIQAEGQPIQIIPEQRKEEDICWILQGEGAESRIPYQNFEPNIYRRISTFAMEELIQRVKPIKAKTLYKTIDPFTGEVKTSSESTIVEQNLEPQQIQFLNMQPSMDFLAELRSKVPQKLDNEILES